MSGHGGPSRSRGNYDARVRLERPDSVDVPEGHHVTTYRVDTEPRVEVTAAGVTVAQLGFASDDPLEMDQVLEELVRRGTSKRQVKMCPHMVRVSELFAPESN